MKHDIYRKGKFIGTLYLSDISLTEEEFDDKVKEFIKKQMTKSSANYTKIC